MAFARSVLISMLLYSGLVECEFRYEDCSINNNVINVTRLEVLPDPVDLKGNLTITVHAELTENIPDSALLEVRYYGIKRIFGIQVDILIPCLLGKYGSCTLPFCHYMQRYEKQVCPVFGNSTSCECPTRIGHYGAEDVEIEMPKPSLITRLLVKGKYRTEMKLKDFDTGEELSCYKVYTELT